MNKIKKLFPILLLSLFLFNIETCYASTKTFNRNELDNYGVKKNWIINESNLNNVLKTKAVDASEKIYDFSEVLSEEEETNLKELIDEFIQKNNMDLVIVTDKIAYRDSIKQYCYNSDIADEKVDKENENYAADFYDYNDFGLKYPNNSGILLVRNTEKDPCFNEMYYDMYTFGNAQLYFGPSRYNSILDGIYEDLHAQNYYAGFKDFIERTNAFVQSGVPKEMKDYYVDENGYLQKNPATYEIPWIIVLSVSAIITCIIMSILIAKNRMVKKATEASDYLQKGSVKITNRQDQFLTSHLSSYTISSNNGYGGSSGGGGGFSSSHGSSGGGHSSGGGRHG